MINKMYDTQLFYDITNLNTKIVTANNCICCQILDKTHT